MRLILDHNVPAPLRHQLKGHDVEEAFERGWERLKNGDLLTASEHARFEVGRRCGHTFSGSSKP